VKIVLPLLCAVLVAGGWTWERHGRAANEGTLAAVASDLAGRPVRIECQSLWADLADINGRLGDVPFPDGHPAAHTYLTRAICGRLGRFRSASSHPELVCLLAVDWSAWSWQSESDFYSPCAVRARPMTEALLTLSHESMHLRGWRDEVAAQCYGIEEVAYTVERLGGTLAEGKAVAQFALVMQPGMPDEYQSGECRAGGGLDLHPETPAFPAEDAPQPPPAGLYGPALLR
jgi:hypothetical protein